MDQVQNYETAPYNTINIYGDNIVELEEVISNMTMRAITIPLNLKVVRFGYHIGKGVTIQINSYESYCYDSGDPVMNSAIYNQLCNLRKFNLIKGNKK